MQNHCEQASGMLNQQLEATAQQCCHCRSCRVLELAAAIYVHVGFPLAGHGQPEQEDSSYLRKGQTGVV